MWRGELDEELLDMPPDFVSTQGYKEIFDAMKANGNWRPGDRLNITDDQAAQIGYRALINQSK